MADNRTEFEQTVANTAAARDTTPDVARSSLVREALQWIIDNQPSASLRTEFADALQTARMGLDVTADKHLADSDHSDDVLGRDTDRATAHSLRVVAQGIGDATRYALTAAGASASQAEQAAAGPSLGSGGTLVTPRAPDAPATVAASSAYRPTAAAPSNGRAR